MGGEGIKGSKAAASLRDSSLKYTEEDFTCLCPRHIADMKNVNVTPGDESIFSDYHQQD